MPTGIGEVWMARCRFLGEISLWVGDPMWGCREDSLDNTDWVKRVKMVRLRCGMVDAARRGAFGCSFAPFWWPLLSERRTSDWCLVGTRRGSILERSHRSGYFGSVDPRSLFDGFLIRPLVPSRIPSMPAFMHESRLETGVVAHLLGIAANAGTEVILWTEMQVFGRKGECSAVRGNGVKGLHGHYVHQGARGWLTCRRISIAHPFYAFTAFFLCSFLFFSPF